MIEYTTVQGDMLDLICFQHYGVTDGTVEKVLEANYRLSDYPLILPAGVTIKLPEIEQEQPADKMINLWD